MHNSARKCCKYNNSRVIDDNNKHAIMKMYTLMMFIQLRVETQIIIHRYMHNTVCCNQLMGN